MTVTCVVQARMGSSRLPGKVLAKVGSNSVLGLMSARLEPLRQRSGWHVVVATSDASADDDIEAEARRLGLPAARGPEHDVLRRICGAVERFPATTVVRLTADCPFVDPELVVAVVDELATRSADYASNTLVRTFPDGLDVEALSTAALVAADAESGDTIEREHVTPYVYRHPRRFLIAQIVTPLRVGDERWTLDTAEDLAWFREVVDHLDDPERDGWRQIRSRVGRRLARPAGRLALVPEPQLAAPQLGPYERRWSVRCGDDDLGTVEVIVEDGGVARLTMDVTEADRDGVRDLVGQSLAADAQVVELEEAG